MKKVKELAVLLKMRHPSMRVDVCIMNACRKYKHKLTFVQLEKLRKIVGKVGE